MEYEGIEQEILLEPENAIVSAVYSVNGKTGDVVLTTSDLENDSDYQTGDEVDAAIATAIAGKQDTLTAGNNIQISAENVISATDTTYSAGNGLNLSSENAFSVDTTVVATQQNLATEVQNRENADNALQAQIDGISASSDVVDIVGTYADLQNYDTQHLKDNDIIKVLQDETQNDATTYYRWSTTTETFTLIGQEGPYYTKAAADAQFVPQTRTVNGKALNTNITLNASDVSALGTSDVVQTTGSSTSQVMSQNATTQALSTKLNITDYVVDDELKNSTNPVQNKVLYNLLGDMPSDFFNGAATSSDSGTRLQFNGAMMVDDVQLNGDTTQQTYSGKNLYNSPDRNQTRYDITAAIANNRVTINGTATRNNFGGTYFNVNGTDNANANYYNYDNTTSGITLAAGTYTLSLNNVTGSYTTPSLVQMFVCSVYSGSYPIPTLATITLTNDQTSATFTIAEETTVKIQFRVQVSSDTSVAVPVFNNYSFDLQLESGSTATSFEPYVGGTASPNPDYPQDIQVVTGTQTVTVSGKNLLALDEFSGSFSSNQYTEFGNILEIRSRYGIAASLDVTLNTFKYTKTSPYDSNQVWKFKGLQPNTNYTVSCNYLITSDIAQAYILGANRPKTNTSLTQPFTTDENGEKEFTLQFYGAAQNDVIELTNLMVEEGSTPSIYEPYQGQDYTVNLGSLELCKIRTYQDYIYKSGDDWYVHKALGKITLDGTQNIAIANWRATATSVGWIYSYNVTQNVPVQFNTDIPAILSDKLMVRTYVQLYDSLVDNGIAVYFNTSLGVVIKTDDTSLTTTTAINNYLNSNPITVYYALATATDTQITDGTLIGQLNALYNAKMLAGQTNFAVSAVSPNLPAILDITVFNANAQGLISSIRGN